MQSKPLSIPGTSRQRIIARSGEVLERAYIFLPPDTWEALTQLCRVSGRSGSQVIESLVNIASRGNLKDKNESTHLSIK